MKVLEDHEKIALGCLCAGSGLMIASLNYHQDLVFHVGLSACSLGFGALVIDRPVNNRQQKSLQDIRGLMIGRKEHGLAQVYRCRKDREFGVELKRLVRGLKGSGHHEVCLSGIAGLLLLPAGPWPEVSKEFIDAVVEKSESSHTIHMHVLLTYPYSVAARNRAIAEALWKRPTILNSPLAGRVAARPPVFENDLPYYRETRLYRDCLDALSFWHHLREKLIGTNATLDVRFCTEDPGGALLRVDDTLFREDYQSGRLSLESQYVSGQLPIHQYSEMATDSSAEFGAAPFSVYKNHFEYLWTSPSTVTIDQVILENPDRVGFKTPVDLRSATDARDKIPLQRMDAVRANCFGVPSRRLFERIRVNRIKTPPLAISCGGRDLTKLLVDVSPRGLRVRVDTTISDTELLQGIRVSVNHVGRMQAVTMPVAEVVLQECNADDADYWGFRVVLDQPLPPWACQVLQRATKSNVTS